MIHFTLHVLKIVHSLDCLGTRCVTLWRCLKLPLLGTPPPSGLQIQQIRMCYAPSCCSWRCDISWMIALVVGSHPVKPGTYEVNMGPQHESSLVCFLYLWWEHVECFLCSMQQVISYPVWRRDVSPSYWRASRFEQLSKSGRKVVWHCVHLVTSSLSIAISTCGRYEWHRSTKLPDTSMCLRRLPS